MESDRCARDDDIDREGKTVVGDQDVGGVDIEREGASSQLTV